MYFTVNKLPAEPRHGFVLNILDGKVQKEVTLWKKKDTRRLGYKRD